MHEGHRNRLKKKFISQGLDGFEPHEILELLLFYSIPRMDTNEIAHRLIEKFGSLSLVLDANIESLTQVKGIGLNSAIMINMLPSIFKSYKNEKWGNKAVLDSSKKAASYVKGLYYGTHYEVFYIVCLDSQNRLNHLEKVHEGTIDEAPIYPRNIVEVALRHKAVNVILSHNHPGGSIKASRADVETTKILKNALETIGIKVVDHIIVGGDKHYSFAENGML